MTRSRTQEARTQEARTQEARTQEALVDRQFGARASAYLQSAVHAQGEDLAALARLAAGKPAARVLDLGCGAGHVSFAVAPHAASVVAYDLSADMLAVVAGAARERGLANVATQQGVAERLPFADASFDCVVSRYSAHHWRDLDAALRETHRVLKPGGIVGFVDSVTPGQPLLDTFLQSIELLRDPSHVRNYTRAEWEAALIRAGLKPGAVAMHQIRLTFSTWVERMRTPPLHVEAIRSLQRAMSDPVIRYFAIGEDGSFDLDVALFEATRIG